MLTTLREKAYFHIRNKIQHRELTAGNRLEELKLAKELGISRVPVREAILQLESEGILCQVPRVGTFVKVPSRDEIREWCELRSALEGFAAEKAALEATPQAIEVITSVHRRMLQLARQIRAEGLTKLEGTLMKEWQQVDLDFHMAVVHAARNQSAEKLVSNLHIMDMFFEVTPEPIPLMVSRVCREHGTVLRAIRQHDPEAARKSMVAQIMSVLELLLDDYSTGRFKANYWNNIQTYTAIRK
ncbi:GntR family transcriptional regulator [Gimesia maris]|uniref:L-lactate dehydrogenase operon regulatory protein n=1 Tax=Gimesia maris TaxID=122 RepID=A0ABX5YVI7_9PLAN|nr:GntR family transcriptional regulator [Gimesia maris]EDL61479.1 hypothetical protein PM8797T_13283 [Gimesia maris DSM 8797]QDU17422.1 Putative L-lactate dehydrogenase operon regulatory protein [Gimesia maris]QEG19486.1 Putative L-lactate dehydrogenase operon regulatory protein [Gimesia maris]